MRINARLLSIDIDKMNKDLQKAVKTLKNGGIVIFPTDTVYGIGCRFDDQKAIEKLYKIKETPKTQSFPILVSSVSQVEKLAKVNPIAQDLIDKYWPGALTIILPSRHPEYFVYTQYKLERRIYSDSSRVRLGQNDTSKVGFRMPDSDLIRSLIDKVGVPIVGTSANFHGKPAPKNFGQIDPELIKLADFAIKGKCPGGIESTVVDATFNPPKILREGAIKFISLKPVIPAKAGINSG